MDLRTARGQKAESLRKSFRSFKDRFEVVEIADISRDQVGDAMKGVWALIHLAYYMPRPDEQAQEMINGTVDGAMNIIKQAEAHGIRHIVVTGSTAAVRNPRGTYNHDDWNPITKEEAINSRNFLEIYCAAKKYSELAIWEWAEAHPRVEVTVVSPPAVYGPWPEDLYLPTPIFSAMTPVFWNLIKPDGQFSVFPGYVDVRDVANAHIRAITHSVPTSQAGRKRLVFSSPHHDWNWASAVGILKEKRPELKERLIKATPSSQSIKHITTDFKRIEEVLSIREDDFLTFEQTLLDAIDNYAKLEQEWLKDGHEVNPPSPISP
ncbi:hypothetical protein VNI00_006613 [Paramarasmius palmivorus]|uniref:NAD-dependent epimerase/dehydratase domain-containing protein n=1 Tax=Paramarasmius palmivorus TaxID=297713 RepID=A0AAW0D7X8_9AGAR